MASILVAEDEPVSRAFLQDALHALGHQAWTEPDGESALRQASAQYFDLLLLDVNLPVLRGPDLLAALRSARDAASVASPAVALSAAIDQALESDLRRLGFAAVASKPIGIEALGKLVAQVLARAPPAASAGLQDWNDAHAMRAAGGARQIVQSLRELMLRDLPSQRSLILQSINAGEFERARAEIHRLRAACGFCGAERLLNTLDPLEHAMLTPASNADAIGAFRTAIDQLLDEVAG